METDRSTRSYFNRCFPGAPAVMPCSCSFSLGVVFGTEWFGYSIQRIEVKKIAPSYPDHGIVSGLRYREVCVKPKTMSTTGKRYIERTKDRSAERVLDARTKAVLESVLNEPRGGAVRAYLLAKGKTR